MSRLHLPHPLVLLVAGILIAAGATWLLPAGQFDRREDAATGRIVVVPGTYHAVEPAPVGLFDAMVAIPRGAAQAADVIFLVFLVGGAFTVVDRTGALRAAVDRLAAGLRTREVLVIPLAGTLFAILGALENMLEEFIALVPVLLILTRALGFDALTAIAMSAGAAMVGASFSPINPFQVGIAQRLAELPLLSGGLYRIAFMVPALGIWLGGTVLHARRTRTRPEAAEPDAAATSMDWRHGTVLALVLAAFAIYVFGVIRLGWGFDQLSAVFFIMGVIAGLIGRLGIDGTARAYADGFREMALAALIIGFARAIFVVLEDGRVIDTIVQGLFTPIAELPAALSAIGMMVAQTAIHVPVPSVSGQAVLTMPVLVPLSDLLGFGPQVAVLAYQYGAGLCDLLTPTNGALMAAIAAAGVRYEDWLRFALPLWLALFVLGAIAVVVGIGVGLR
ncbi:MAG TPA: Na+/H+ antiporter NhaC family protein [Longimicrobiales bacterium]